jgi:DNA-binding NarL/FixJ family response regulator
MRQGCRGGKPDAEALWQAASPRASAIAVFPVPEFPSARTFSLRSMNSQRARSSTIQAGAAGYLLKTTPREELLTAIRNVHRGKKSVPHEIAAQIAEHLNYEPLSQREIEVLGHLGGGKRNREIAQILFISEETVKAHVKHIMEKLGANDRTHALAIGVRRGIIQI